MILLTTTAAEAANKQLVEANGGRAVPLSLFPEWTNCQIPGRQFFPTLPGALRAAMQVPYPAFLAVNCVPHRLFAMPTPYQVPEKDAPNLLAKPLPTEPGMLGVDFAVAFGLCQLAVAVKLHKEGMREHSAYFVEAAGLSAGVVCSVPSAEIMEQMNAACCNDPDTFPLPDGILWPDGVAGWLQGFGFNRDNEGG